MPLHHQHHHRHHHRHATTAARSTQAAVAGLPVLGPGPRPARHHGSTQRLRWLRLNPASPFAIACLPPPPPPRAQHPPYGAPSHCLALPRPALQARSRWCGCTAAMRSGSCGTRHRRPPAATRGAPFGCQGVSRRPSRCGPQLSRGVWGGAVDMQRASCPVLTPSRHPGAWLHDQAEGPLCPSRDPRALGRMCAPPPHASEPSAGVSSKP